MAAGGIFTVLLLRDGKTIRSSPADLKAAVKPGPPLIMSEVHLYFADKENAFLSAEKKSLLHSEDPAEFGSRIINALISGPRGDLMPTIPDGAALSALYVTPEGTAYVDITEAMRDDHPGGAKTELMTLYSIVNSLILNIPQIRFVKILTGGRESSTLAGHIDLQFPYKADMLLVR